MNDQVVHFEVIGTNGPELEKFYAELFGWHVQSMPEMNYGIVDTHAGAGINGGIGTSEEGEKYATFYVEVDDPQAALDRAESLGGRTLMPVMEIPNVVTMAQFADPAGNRIGVVRSDPDQPGPGVSPGDGTEVSWFEVHGPDAKRLRDFYAELFGWKIEGGSSGDSEYYQFDSGDGRGISGGIGRSQDGQPHTTIYARVEDLPKALERAESLGGKTVLSPMKADTVEFAQFADPQGNVFGLYRMLQ